MSMTEEQAKKFLVSETKRYAHKIAPNKRVRVLFEKSLGKYRGQCGYSTIWYSRQTILANLDNKKGLTDLAIHECIHLKISGHGPNFQKEYVKWTGNPESEYVTTLNSERYIKPKAKRGAGKTLRGKWKVEYVRCTREPYPNSPTGYAISQVAVKEKAMTKTEAMKIYRMACSKNYPAWLFQYVESTVAHGWKKIEYHERVT
jgi:hypothetical protein